MRLGWVPLAVSLVPLVAIHSCYLLAAQNGHVPCGACVRLVGACIALGSLAGLFGEPVARLVLGLTVREDSEPVCIAGVVGLAENGLEVAPTIGTESSNPSAAALALPVAQVLASIDRSPMN